MRGRIILRCLAISDMHRAKVFEIAKFLNALGLRTRECGTDKVNPVSDKFDNVAVCDVYRVDVFAIMQDSVALGIRVDITFIFD